MISFALSGSVSSYGTVATHLLTAVAVLVVKHKNTLNTFTKASNLSHNCLSSWGTCPTQSPRFSTFGWSAHLETQATSLVGDK